jgi:O-antigen ligase
MATTGSTAATATRRPGLNDPEGLPAARADRTLTLVIQSFLALSLFGAPLAFGAVQTWCWAFLVEIAVLMLVLWAASSARQRRIELAWSPLFVPLGLFLALVVFQFLIAHPVDFVSTRNALLTLSAAMIFFFLAVQFSASATIESWRLRGLVIVTYTFSVSLFAVVQYFTDHTRIYWLVTPRWPGWVFGPYVNHNHYAGLMEMLIPLSAGYALSSEGPLKLSLGFALLIPVASVLLSGSRGGMLALLLEGALLIVIALTKGHRERRRLVAAAVTGAISVAVLGFVWMDQGGLTKRLQTPFESSGTSEVGFASRKQVALDSFRMAKDHLWLGTGLGSFALVYPKYQSVPTDAVWDHAHNDYIEALGETGLLGGALIVLALAVGLRLAFVDLDDRLRHRLGWIQLGAALGCCGLLLHSLLDFNLHIPANAVWFAVCAAIATSAPARPDGYAYGRHLGAIVYQGTWRTRANALPDPGHCDES